MARYTTVTELPGTQGSLIQIEKLYQRYRFAYDRCKGKDVLEVACGAGQGLGYLAKTAKQVLGGDIDEDCLGFARAQYAGCSNVRLEHLDAQKIPYPDGSFDVVIMFEAIYYLQDPDRFVKEASRVLREDGRLILCTTNKDSDEFNPSSFSKQYFSVPQLLELLNEGFSQIDCFGGFKASRKGVKGAVSTALKRGAVRLGIMPKTMKSKELLKRLFYGKLHRVPEEVTDCMASYDPPEPIANNRADEAHSVIYAVARK